MVNVCAVLVIMAYFAISPVLASLLPLENGMWTLLVTVPSFFLSPVSASLPIDNGVPRAINMINEMMRYRRNVDGITREIGWAVERWGYTELKQYCELSTTRQRFDRQCGKLDELYTSYYVGHGFTHEYYWDQQHFTVHSITASLDAYLTIIGNNMGGREPADINERVTENLNKALLENGLNEMKKYCKGENQENTEACKLIRSMTVSYVKYVGYRYHAPEGDGSRSHGIQDTRSNPAPEDGGSTSHGIQDTRSNPAPEDGGSTSHGIQDTRSNPKPKSKSWLSKLIPKNKH